MRHNRLIYILLGLLLPLLPAGCREDDFPFEIPGEGETEVWASVIFEPLTSALHDTRTPGNAIKQIKSLSVIVYDSKGEFVGVYNKTDNVNDFSYYNDKEINTEMPKDENGNPIGDQAEAQTTRVEFRLPDIPYGRYKMYAVANMGAISEEEAKDIENIKKINLKWNETDIAANNQMFGYFTSTDDQNGGANGFDAPTVTISKNHKSVHAWIKRAASKVTIAYDPSGLNQGVWIYIHDVCVRDIPINCLLGADNEPKKEDELLYPYNMPLSQIPNASKILYNKDGEVPETEYDSDQYQDFKNDVPKSVYQEWLTLAKGSGIKGSSHSEDANALYFFENMQGDYSQNKEHDKIVTEQDIWDNEGECSTKPGDPDFKNGVRYGTYIEVTAYYVSQNPQNVTQGKIKYRFMLGKDDEYNFNAQRNHHFKLTLGFDGWANQPLWNIEYYEQDPGIYLPDQFDVSYLYNQKHMLPIKIVGECESLKVEIVENNWAPYDPDQSDEVPPQDADPSGGMYRFQWNRPAWANTSHTYKYRQKIITEDTPESELNNNTFFGFLALAVPVNGELPPKTIVNRQFGDGVDAQKDLKDYYDTNGGVSDWNTGNQGVRNFTKEQLDPEGGITDTGAARTDGAYYPGHNGWQVSRIDNDSKMLHIPVFTRNKSMIIGSGFSGNNPYESYKRKAVVRVTAKFPKKGGGYTTIIKQVPVLQAERVVNPKGVWRKWNDKEDFKVELMKVIQEGKNIDGGNYFETFRSTGAWKAYIEVRTPGSNFLTLNGLGTTDTVFGDTDTPIEFTLNFNGVDESTSACAVVRVDYNGYNCVHKIMVRQGYMAPMTLGNAKWSSFSLYKCTKNAATTGSPDNIEVEMTVNPLALGSFFKRHNTLEGIRIINNNSSFEYTNGTTTEHIEGKGPLDLVGNYKFLLTDSTRLAWTSIKGDIPNITNNGTNCDDETSTWGTFQSTTLKKKYRLPTYDEFTSLESKEFGFGVLYTDGSTKTAQTWDGAYGYQAPNNLENGPDTGKGARGVIVYDRDNANQIFFPVGRNGMGRRTQFSIQNTDYRGVLRYADVYYLLSADNDYFRPVPYNLPIVPGAIYWTNVVKNKGNDNKWPVAGWDMNYFNFDFNSYPDNNTLRFNDARPIKMVVTGDL